MPFPPKQVFIDYLNLYYSIRTEDRGSWATFLKTGAESLASYVTGSGPVVNQLDSHLTTMEAAIKAAADFDDWFRLIFTLRKTAEECQDAKWKAGTSLSCQVLHGVASLILRELHNSDEFKDKLSVEIEKRKTRIKELKQFKKTSLTAKNGQSVNDYNDEIKKIIDELAQLSEITFIEKAAKYKLFSYLPIRKEVDIITYTNGRGNRVGLIELQFDYCDWLYASEFQKTKKHIGFEQFLQDSKDSFQKLLQLEENRRKQTANADAATSLSGDALSDDASSSAHADAALPSTATAAAAAAATVASSSSNTGPSTAATGMFASTTTAKRRARASTANDDSAASAANTANIARPTHP